MKEKRKTKYYRCNSCLDEIDGKNPCVLTIEDEDLIDKPELCPFDDSNDAKWIEFEDGINKG